MLKLNLLLHMQLYNRAAFHLATKIRSFSKRCHTFVFEVIYKSIETAMSASDFVIGVLLLDSS